MLILEENSRLKRIWERSKRGLLELVKSKLAIAEKDIELKEVRDFFCLFGVIKVIQKQQNNNQFFCCCRFKMIRL